MFEKTYIFQGKHAKYVKNLSDNTLFNRNLDVLLVSPIIGFLNGKKSKLDKGNDVTKINAEQIISDSEMIEFIFQLITVQDINTFPDEEDRFNRAFRYKNGEKYEEAIDNCECQIRFYTFR